MREDNHYSLNRRSAFRRSACPRRTFAASLRFMRVWGQTRLRLQLCESGDRHVYGSAYANKLSKTRTSAQFALFSSMNVR
jgi:hypothetical protein